MSLDNEIKKLMDLPLDMAYKEAANKLVDTWIKVNGTICYLRALDMDGLLVGVRHPKNMKIADITISADDVDKLEVFLPETGVYFDKENNPIILEKLPIRQWSKSFKKENYKTTSPEKQTYADLIEEDSRTEFWISKDGMVRYYTHIVGKVLDDSSIVCYNSLYKQDLIDWAKT